MFKKLKEIAGSHLFKVSSLNFVSIVVKIIGGLVSSKIIALFIGPAGLALVGNFRNFITSLESFSTLGFQNGIVKYVAESESDRATLSRVLSTILFSVLFAIITLSAVLILPSEWWSTLIFEDSRFYWVFNITAFLLPLYTGNLVFIAVLNGFGNYKSVININIWGNISGVLLSAFIIWRTGLNGALFSIVASPAIMFFLSFYLLHRQLGGWQLIRFKNFSFSYLKGLLSYSTMILVTAILSPYVFLSIRKLIIDRAGADPAGHWEAMNRIAVFYLMFFTTLLSVYFLPKLSVAQNDSETKKVFYSYFKGIVPLFVVAAVGMYFFRYLIIKIILTPDFIPTADLFGWQLVGDFFKVCSLILGFEFFAKKMTRAYIAAEIMSFSILYFSSHFLIRAYGVQGAVMAHAVTYAVYFAVLIVIFRKKLL